MTTPTPVRWLLCAAVVIGCSESAGPQGPDASRAATHLEKVAGDGQQATVATTLREPLRVRALDSSGRPVPGITITWAVDPGHGTLRAAATQTNAEGAAQAEWQLGIRPGVQGATATAVGLQPVRFTTHTTADRPAAITLSHDSLRLTTIGDTARVAPTVADRHGNPLEAAIISWTSADVGIVVVSNDGVVRATGSGRAAITARADTVERSLWVTVAASSFGRAEWATYTSGERFACGTTPDRLAWCWGDNSNGAVGVGTDVWRYDAPVPVAGGIRFSSLNAGEDNVCGVAVTGRVYCWGKGRHGQLGDGASEERNAPTAVKSDHLFAAVTAGPLHACALTTAGAAYCWGNGEAGQLGDGSLEDRSTPVAVAGGLTFVAISAGIYHTCGLTAVGAAYCWGSARLGVLGTGAVEGFSAVPVAVSGGIEFAEISAGGFHTCALAAVGGAIYCWGANLRGELGVPTGMCDDSVPIACASSPVRVPSDLTFTRIAAAGLADGGSVCALAADGAAHCWGYSAPTGARPPTLLPGGLRFTSISVGPTDACGIALDRTVYCWPPGTPAPNTLPIRIPDRQ